MRRRGWLVASLLVVGMVAVAQNAALAKPGSDKPEKSRSMAAEATGAGTPPAGFASWSDVMKVQRRLDTKAEKILAERDAGFAGIEVAAESRRLTVSWKGRPPAAAEAAMQRARRDSDQVELRPARYSETELMAEGNRIIRQDGVTAVAPKVDGSGLLVSVAPGRLGVILSTVPLTTEEAQPQPASRADDSPPYRGGAVWFQRGRLARCSTGFAIEINGARKMLSAGHCGSNTNLAADGGGQTMGAIAGDDDTHDRLYIETISQGEIYNGGVGSGEVTTRVVGASQSFVGDIVCASGARSGTRCNAKVVATNQMINAPDGLVVELVRAEQQNREAIVGSGDSGGPVFNYAAPDNAAVVAKGIVSGIDRGTRAPCTGAPSSRTRECAWRFYFVDVQLSLNAYNANIVRS